MLPDVKESLIRAPIARSAQRQIERLQGQDMSQSSFLSRACPVCGANDASVEASSDRRAEAMSMADLKPFWSGFFKERVFFSYARCGSCGILFTPRFFTDEQLADLYADMAPNMDAVSNDAIAATQKGYFDEVSRVAELGGGYLEIGPDTGHIVRHAAQTGRFDHFWLFEPNRAVHGALAAATLGQPHLVSADMTDLGPVPDASVGLAVMVHVLDHLLDPMAMLTQIRQKLRPGGTLMIVTHNEASLLRKVMGKRWPPFCLQHPEIFNPDSMTDMIRRADYADVKVARSANHFPIDFMAKQAALAVGVKLNKVPLPRTPVRVKLGNMITIASR